MGLGEAVKQFSDQKPWWASLGLLGLTLVVVGVISISMAGGGNDKEIEIVEVDKGESEEILVDVSGAVEKQGLYRLVDGSRVNDALIAAGGLSQEADREWVTKNINLAQKLVDGVKLYIPFKGETAVGGESGSVAGTQVTGKINVNVASMAELDKLWGVGEATAKKIIDNRPYGSVEELLSKKVLKSNVYQAIKDEVSVF